MGIYKYFCVIIHVDFKLLKDMIIFFWIPYKSDMASHIGDAQ